MGLEVLCCSSSMAFQMTQLTNRSHITLLCSEGLLVFSFKGIGRTNDVRVLVLFQWCIGGMQMEALRKLDGARLNE